MQTQFHQQDQQIVVASAQDVEPILTACHDRQAAGQHGSGEMRHAASIPMVLVERYCTEQGISFQEWLQDKTHVKAMLNDPALSAFRIWRGRV